MTLNPVDYAEAAKVLGIAMMALGAALLTLVVSLMFRRKPECNCDD